MVRIAPLALLALSMVPSPARADDPAIVACEGTVLAEVPAANYRRISAAVDLNFVTIGYQLATDRKPKQARCTFKFAAEKGWEFDTSSPPEASACKAHGDRVIALMRAGATARARREKARLEYCLDVLKAERARQLGILFATHTLLNRSAYPIQPESTALKRP